MNEKIDFDADFDLGLDKSTPSIIRQFSVDETLLTITEV